MHLPCCTLYSPFVPKFIVWRHAMILWRHMTSYRDASRFTWKLPSDESMEITFFDLVTLILTYNFSLAKVKVNSHTRNQGHRSNGLGRRVHTDRQTDTHTHTDTHAHCSDSMTSTANVGGNDHITITLLLIVRFSIRKHHLNAQKLSFNLVKSDKTLLARPAPLIGRYTIFHLSIGQKWIFHQSIWCFVNLNIFWTVFSRCWTLWTQTIM